MNWNQFIYFAAPSVLCWAIGAWASWRSKSRLAFTFTVVGLLLFFAFIVAMWMSLERPPLRTKGETRLWYSFFLPLAGIIVYSRWRYKWILSFSTLLAVVFICVNLFKPEIHNKTLMPALQSPWFAPHVIVYMFAYALFGAATVMAVYQLFFASRTGRKGATAVVTADSGAEALDITDNLVSVGYCFMTLGMLFGALWAKEAWGHYWSWDPKETWAAITWFAYLVYIHLRTARPRAVRPSLWILVLAFVLLQMCWWGINYLPSAQGTSVHTYNM